DYVQSNFTDDITRRRSSVQLAFKREGGGTMPVIWSGGSADPDEEDEYFIGASLSGMSAAAIHAAATAVDGPPSATVTAPTKVEMRPRLPTESPRLPTAPPPS